LLSAPAGKLRQQLEGEAEIAVILTTVAPAREPVTGFATSMLRLQWRDATLTRLVHAYAHVQTSIFGLPIPDVCGDIRAWSASGYVRLPPTTTALLAQQRHAFAADESEIEQRLLRALAPHETHAEKKLLRQAARVEEAQSRTLTPGLREAVSTLGRVLPAPDLSLAGRELTVAPHET
jgi:hypothetical protein